MQALDSRSIKVIPIAMVLLSIAVLAGLLVALSVIDLKTFRLPNVLTFTLIGSGLIEGWIRYEGLPEGIWGGFTDRLIGAAVGYLVFVAVEKGFKHITGKDGMGRGDAKLLAGGGAWCGWMVLPYIVMIASFMGLIAALFPSFRKAGRIPFGPFLALGIISVWFALNIQRLPV